MIQDGPERKFLVKWQDGTPVKGFVGGSILDTTTHELSNIAEIAWPSSIFGLIALMLKSVFINKT